jgi:hypothetical protein
MHMHHTTRPPNAALMGGGGGGSKGPMGTAVPRSARCTVPYPYSASPCARIIRTNITCLARYMRYTVMASLSFLCALPNTRVVLCVVMELWYFWYWYLVLIQYLYLVQYQLYFTASLAVRYQYSFYDNDSSRNGRSVQYRHRTTGRENK